MPDIGKLGFDYGEVINLAVVHDYVTAIAGDHRLVTQLRQVEN